MAVRIVMGLVMMAIGAFAFYTVVAKPHQDFSGEPFDQAIGIPKIVTRVIRGVFGLLFVLLGIITIARTVGLLR